MSWQSRVICWLGERAGARTQDPVIKSHVLYRLSYALPWPLMASKDRHRLRTFEKHVLPLRFNWRRGENRLFPDHAFGPRCVGGWGAEVNSLGDCQNMRQKLRFSWRFQRLDRSFEPVWRASSTPKDTLTPNHRVAVAHPSGQFASRRTSLGTACALPGPGRATGRRPISTAVRIALSRQNWNELMRLSSRIAIATAARNGRLCSTRTPAKM